MTLTFVISTFQATKILLDRAKTRKLQEEMLQYKPTSTGVTQGKNGVEMVNQDILDLQAIYPNVAGWISIDGTEIDYPFVRSADNNEYLRHNLKREHSMAGTIFVDYRCEEDFSGVNTILYGHHMKDGSMFASMKWFEDVEFFCTNVTGVIYLPRKTLHLEILALVVSKADDENIYGLNAETNEKQEEYLAYIKENARYYRDVEPLPGERYITLSTCSYEADDARMVLICRIKP